MNLRQFEQLFKAFSDKQRIRILALLSDGPLAVNQITSVLHLSMSTISQHLTILRNANLVIDDKKGRWVYYSITDEARDKKTMAGSIYKELQKYFEEEEFIYDKKMLQKLSKPQFDVKKP